MTDAPNNEVLVHLTAGECSVLISSGGGMPQLVHWGAPLGEVDGRVLAALERPVPRGGLDVDAPLGLVAESSVGWFGTPGIEGHRPDGSDFAPQFLLRSTEATSSDVRFELTDAAAALDLRIVVVLQPSGVVTFAVSLTNGGPPADSLGALGPRLPIAAPAARW